MLYGLRFVAIETCDFKVFLDIKGFGVSQGFGVYSELVRKVFEGFFGVSIVGVLRDYRDDQHPERVTSRRRPLRHGKCFSKGFQDFLRACVNHSSTPFLKVINSEYIKLLIANGEERLERAKVVKEEIVEQNARFLAVYVESKNSCMVLLSEKEDKLGTLAIAVPKPKDLLGPPSSSVLLGDKNGISARMFAEHLASVKEKIALVSVYLETMDERQAQLAFKRLLEKILHDEPQKEALTA